MTDDNAVIAVFTDHQGTEAAVKKLADASKHSHMLARER